MDRYKVFYDNMVDCGCEMDVSDSGGYVEYEEVERLQKRIKELEDGCCRFNCRTQKEAYIAGAQDTIYRIKRYEDGAAPTLAEIQKAYKHWKEKEDG